MKLHANTCNVFFKRGHKKCCVKFCFCWVITLSTIIQEWLLYTIRKWRRKVYLPVPWYVINTLQSFQMDIEFIKISLSGKEKNTMTFKNHANQVSKIQNEKDRKLLKSWYCKRIVTILINICMPFGNVLILAEAKSTKEHKQPNVAHLQYSHNIMEHIWYS